MASLGRTSATWAQQVLRSGGHLTLPQSPPRAVFRLPDPLATTRKLSPLAELTCAHIPSGEC